MSVSLYAPCCGTTFTGPDPRAMHVEYHNYQHSQGRRESAITPDAVEEVDSVEYVELDAPADRDGTDLPAYEGTVGLAYQHLAPGVYRGRCLGWTDEGETDSRAVRVVVGHDKIISAVYA